MMHVVWAPKQRSAGPPLRQDRVLLVIRLLLLVLVLAVFGRILGNEFVDWDDGGLIYANPNLNPPTWSSLVRHWDPRDKTNISLYDPLVFTVWWGLACVSRLNYPDVVGATLNPMVYHGANLLVHWLSACVVLEILLQLRLSPWPAGIGAMLFAIHPLQTEAVAWATGMKDLLSGLLALAAIWRYLVAMQSQGRQRRWKWAEVTVLNVLFGAILTPLLLTWNSLGASVLYALALLSKPSAVVVPGMVWVLDVVIFGRSWKQSLLRVVPWLALAVGATVVAAMIQSTQMLKPVSLWHRPLIAADALTFYLYKLMVPIRLSCDYGRTPAAVLVDPLHPLYWSWLVPVALALVLWRSRNKILIAAGLIFLMGLLPVLGLVTFVFQFFSTVADRYVYLSMLGVAMAAAWAVQRGGAGRVGPVAAGVLMVLGALSFAQAGMWKDTETLYQRAVATNPNNPNHLIVFGEYRGRQSDIALRRSQQAAAQQDARQAAAEAQLSRQYLLDAIDFYRQANRLAPMIPEVYDLLSRDLILTGQLDQAIATLQEWIDLQPKLPENRRTQPAVLRYTLGMAYFKAHRWAEAVRQLELSLQLKNDPNVEQWLQQAREKMRASSQPATAPSP
ncbi:MAG: hypothetical protein ABR964_07390 [Tepidisphaeraceae bacterium]|jgi:hypothetical protein